MGSARFSTNQAVLQADGAVIEVQVSYPLLDYEDMTSLGLSLPKPKVVKALIDTGSSRTVINPRLAQNLGLESTGSAHISAVGHLGEYSEYPATISFPGTNLARFDVVRIVAVDLFRQEYSCLIGRDTLRRWKLTFDGRSGRVEIEE
jgi:predicted aspartyl protease